MPLQFFQIIFLSLFLTFSVGQEEVKEKKPLYPVTELTDPNISVMGDLTKGKTMTLQWAENSAVGCFPGTRFREYQGNHILYRVNMPAASDMKITVTPIDKSNRINFYALRLPEGNTSTPPDMARSISCEAAYPMYAGKPNLNKGNKAKSVEYMSIHRPYTILIGVAGAKGVLAGQFELKVETTSR